MNTQPLPPFIDALVNGQRQLDMDGVSVGVSRQALDEALTEREALIAQVEMLRADKARLDFLQNECNDLRCFDYPTGGDDREIGWRVIAHYQAEPCERVVGEVWNDELREAIDQALSSKSGSVG
jgi:hypothetical protein